jgi:hypothetical protein
MIGNKKVMITISLTGMRLIVLHCLSRGRKYNKEYFTNLILEDINETCNHGHGQRVTKDMLIHMDNWKVHNYQESSCKIQCMRLTRLPHPAYSPDLSPCDFWFFGYAKNSFRVYKRRQRTILPFSEYGTSKFDMDQLAKGHERRWEESL